MLINKYGILIKKSLQEKYPEQYNKLKEKGNLLAVVRDKQFEVELAKRKMLEQNKGLLTQSKKVEILDNINKSIAILVDEIGNEVK